MSLLTRAVNAIGTADDAKSLSDAISGYLDANNAADKAAALGKVAVEVSAGVLTAVTLRPAFSALRLGLVVTGQMERWRELSKVLGIGAGMGAGEIIDWLNSLHFGSKLYDILHPNDAVNTDFNRAKNWTWPSDPILLDLNNNGLETVGLASNVYFDHDGDGVLTKTGWAGTNDALLVWDRNANGSIDTGAELFGDFTPLPNGTLAPNGFAALAALDANGDGILDAADLAFAELKLWRDTSQDGQTGTGELISLLDAGIVSLNLANTLKNQRLSNGNTLSREGSFTRADGTTSAMGEFRLATDTFDTKFADEIAVPEALKTLPNMGGAGNVRELQQAAAQSSDVADLLAQFQSATTRAEQKALLDPLLSAWAGTSGMTKSLDERVDAMTEAEMFPGKTIPYTTTYRRFGSQQRSFTPLDELTSGDRASYMTLNDPRITHDVDNPYLSAEFRQSIADWTRKMHILESFNGSYFFGLPGPLQGTGAAVGMSFDSTGGGGGVVLNIPIQISYTQPQLDLLQQAYDSLKESVYASLVMQTRLKPYLDQIELIIDYACCFDTDTRRFKKRLAREDVRKSRRWQDGESANMAWEMAA